MRAQPNIILITLHDIGRQLQCYDQALPPTQGIINIAENGAVFENHFTTSPLCSPARSSIQTGRFPHCNGMNGLTHRGFKLNESEKCIPHYLNGIGYHTAVYGYQHESEDDVPSLGYKEICLKPDYPQSCEEIMPHVICFLERKHNKPFFLSLGFMEVHRPFTRNKSTKLVPEKIKVPHYLPNCSRVREDLVDFYSILEKVDKSVLQLQDKLSSTGLKENTLLIFTTDHGEAFPRAKSTLYDTGLGVTLLVQWPEIIKPGTKITSMTSHVDILPTILDIAKIERPSYIQGQSFLTLLRGDKSNTREYIYAEKSWHGNEYDPMRCIRTEKWKYIINFTEGYLYQTPLDIKLSPSGKIVEEKRKIKRPVKELYNLEDDVHETTNLAENPDYYKIQQLLDKKLRNWMKKTNDPLLKGNIKWPQIGKKHYMNNMDLKISKKNVNEK